MNNFLQPTTYADELVHFKLYFKREWRKAIFADKNQIFGHSTYAVSDDISKEE